MVELYYVLLVLQLLFLLQYFSILGHYHLILELCHFQHQSQLNYFHCDLVTYSSIQLVLQYYFLLIDFRQYKICYYICLLNIYYESIVYLVSFLLMLIIVQQCIHNNFIFQVYDTNILVFQYHLKLISQLLSIHIHFISLDHNY